MPRTQASSYHPTKAFFQVAGAGSRNQPFAKRSSGAGMDSKKPVRRGVSSSHSSSYNPRVSARSVLVLESELSDEVIVGFLECATQERQVDDSSMPSWEDPVSVFFSVTKPEIETSLYVKRLVRYAQCSRSAFVIGIVYLRRLEESNPKLAISPYNLHRLLITAIMLAAKNLDDRCYSNAHYARVGGLATVREVNRLELQMLTLLRFNIFVSPEEYNHFVESLKRGVVPRSPSHITRVHTVFPTRFRRFAQSATVSSLIPERTNNSDADTALLRDDGTMQLDGENVYRFDAPRTAQTQVLPLSPNAPSNTAEP